jgi:hypothetical protein
MLKMSGLPIDEFELFFVAKCFALLVFLYLSYRTFSVISRNQLSAASKYLIPLIGIITAGFSLFGIKGAIFGYLTKWIAVLGIFAWAALLSSLYCFFTSNFVALERREHQFCCAFLIIILSSLTILLAIFQGRQIEIATPPVQTQQLAKSLMARLTELNEPVNIQFDWSDWTTQSAIILRLYKEGIPFCIDNVQRRFGETWPLFFPSCRYSSNQWRVVFSTGPYSGKVSGELVAECCGKSVHLLKSGIAQPD